MRFFKLILVAACAVSVGCNSLQAGIDSEIAAMTLREKVARLFIVRTEALDTACVPGGVILFAKDLPCPDSARAVVSRIKALPGEPLVCIDEEGGRVARIGNNPSFGVAKTPSMASLSASGTQAVEDAAFAIGTYLRQYGIDVDFAPVADVNTNPENIVIGDRAFSTDPGIAAHMVCAYLRGLKKAGVAGCLKHFPGHGDTRADTHEGYAVSHKTWEEMAACEMIPFRAGIQEGAPMVMSAHISAPAVTGDDTPSTLSRLILEEKLRGELGFEGVIVSDAMEMGAISKVYSGSESCLLAIAAGVDMLLCVSDYPSVVDDIVKAVENGDIPESRIDDSLRRILLLKKGLPQ